MNPPWKTSPHPVVSVASTGHAGCSMNSPSTRATQPLAQGDSDEAGTEFAQAPARLPGVVISDEGPGEGLRGEKEVALPGEDEHSFPERAGVDDDRHAGPAR